MLRKRNMQAVGRMLLKCKTPHFFIPHWSSSKEFEITKYYDPVRHWDACSQDNDSSCHADIHFFLALCDHNPPTLQMDRCHARSIIVTYNIARHIKNARIKGYI